MITQPGEIANAGYSWHFHPFENEFKLNFELMEVYQVNIKHKSITLDPSFCHSVKSPRTAVYKILKLYIAELKEYERTEKS